MQKQEMIAQSPEEKQNEDKGPESRKKAIVKEILSWVWTIALAFLIAYLLNSFVIVNANVPTGSMLDTIQVNDRLIGFRLSYLSEEPQRGDIVMFKYPLDESQIYIKRLIGLPGEHLEIREGKVYINGSETPLEENYLKEEWIEANDGLSYDIPEDCFFMMGDNRNNSLDGRYWCKYAVQYGLADSIEQAQSQKLCFVQRDQIIGKAIFRYFPSITMLNENPYEQ